MWVACCHKKGEMLRQDHHRISPRSDHAARQDDTGLPETVLHFALLYLTFPGISANFLV